MADTFTKTDFAFALSTRTGLPQNESAQIIEHVLAILAGEMIRRQRITLPGLGVFTVRERKARTGRNPKTGAPVEIPAKRVVAFKPGKELKAKLNGENDES